MQCDPQGARGPPRLARRGGGTVAAGAPIRRSVIIRDQRRGAETLCCKKRREAPNGVWGGIVGGALNTWKGADL